MLPRSSLRNSSGSGEQQSRKPCCISDALLALRIRSAAVIADRPSLQQRQRTSRDSWRCGFRAGSVADAYIFLVIKTRRGDCASVARILKELTRSSPSVAGVVYSDKRTKISAETGALGRFY